MRAALFDLDETLLDRSGSLRDFATWQANGMLRCSVRNTNLFVERFIALDQNGLIWKDKVYESLIKEFGITDWSVDDLLNVYMLTFCAFCKPRAGAIAVTKRFRSKGFRLALVTNGKSPFQERNFRALGCSSLFDSVVVSEAVGVRKPDKSIFQLACRNIGADIGSSVFIGDNPVADIKGAKDAGMTTIYVPSNLRCEQCEFADATFFDLSDLVSYIESEY